MSDCRLLPFALRDGALNMAIDEALLLACEAGGPALTLRLYGWARPTLSLGYFQSPPAGGEGPWARLPMVRRLTGGGAIVHDAEVTYSVIWRYGDAPPLPFTERAGVRVRPSSKKEPPPPHPALSPGGRGIGRRGVVAPADVSPVPPGVAAAYGHLNRALVTALRFLGVEAAPADVAHPLPHPLRRGRGVIQPPSRAGAPQARHFLCFRRRSPYDLVAAGQKVVGSAQRRRPGAVLQHGSILVGPSALRGVEDRSISELVGRAIALGEAAAAVVKGFEEALGWGLAPGRLSVDEGHLAEGLRHHQYNHLSWGGRRRRSSGGPPHVE